MLVAGKDLHRIDEIEVTIKEKIMSEFAGSPSQPQDYEAGDRRRS